MTGTWRARAADFFALDEEWVREPPSGAVRRDAVVATVLFALSGVVLELARSAGGLRAGHAVWQEYAGLAAMAATIAVRRRWPVLGARRDGGLLRRRGDDAGRRGPAVHAGPVLLRVVQHAGLGP